jgi:outer membrane immunogenic protein
MKKILLALAALATVGVAAPALGADLGARPYYNKVPPVYAAPNWTGFYIGGHIGGAFRDGGTGFGGDTDARFLGGGQIGADYQFSGSWLVGIEANYSYVDGGSGTPFAFPGGAFSNNLRGLASVTGRLGYTWGPGLLYAKGGYAYADMRNDSFGAFAFDNGRDGYTVGGGIEYMFAQNWSGKIEYQYYDFGRNGLFVGAPLVFAGDVRNDQHTIKGGLNYHFNLLSPLAPRY